MTTVIITLYEQLETLEALLFCLERQTYCGRWEVIVTDDGSSRDAMAIVRSACARGSLNARFIWQQDRGFRAASARNNAIRQANGDILIFLDADMLVEDNFVATHTSLHKISGSVICGTRDFALVDDFEDLYARYRSGRLKRLNTPEIAGQFTASQSSNPWMALVGSNFSVRGKSGVLFDEGFAGWGYEDREYAYRMTAVHGYCLSVSSLVQATHISRNNMPDSWQPLRNADASHAAILTLLRNIVYFFNLHPEADQSPAVMLLQKVTLNPGTDLWCRTPGKRRSGTSLELVREWFGRNDKPAQVQVGAHIRPPNE